MKRKTPTFPAESWERGRLWCCSGRPGQRLASLVRSAGNRIATGFAGTPVITDALTVSGGLDAAYDLLLEKECPSWLYAVSQGGTTIWERWDSMLPDGTGNPGR